MSTKDLLDRLNRASSATKARSPRSGATGTSSSTGPTGTEDKRVKRRVIRRRRVASEPEPAPSVSAKSATPSQSAPAAPRRRVAPQPAAPAPAQAAAPAPVAAPAPAPEAVATPAPAPAPAVVATPAPAPAPQAAPEAKVVEAAPVAQAPAAPAPAPAAPVAAKPAPAVVAEPAPAPAPVAAAPAPAAPAPAPAAAPEPISTAASLARALPRADGSGPRGDGAAPKAAKSFPGLGSAVVSPPPGYDPNDPMGNRRRAQAAAAASVRGRRPAPAARPAAGAAPGGAAQPSDAPKDRAWRDQTTPGRPDARADKDRRTRRTRRGGARAGRVNMYGMDGMPRGRRGRRGKKASGPKKLSPQAKAIKRRVEVQGTITVAQLAHAMSAKAGQLIKTLIGMGQMATVNDVLDFDTATLVAAEFEFEVVNASFQEEKLMIDIEDDPENMDARPPVVTIMGHVDHGKTTLLDTIRRANVASGEAGGITQHISSYQVEHNGEPITFIDTPGHAAFTAMRARGAQVTDIVVLVVAADDGVMPQTVEVINHAKAADVEIIVAVNKCDKPDARPERVRQEMMQYGLVAEEFGGETMFVNVSAMTGAGVEDLLEAINLAAELGDYQANSDRHAEGTVLEARLERGKGPVAIVLIQAGTLNRGDHFVVGTSWGRIRALTDHRGKKIKTAGPSDPVEIMGISEVPMAGDSFVVVGTDKDAKTLAEHRLEEARQSSLGQHKRMTLEELMKRGSAEEKVTLNLIVKADVGGSLEALKASFASIDVEGTEIKILHDGVGAVSESDVTLAHTNQGVIIAFNVRPDANARRIIDGFGVEVRTYKVIYEAIEEVELALKGLLGPEIREVVQGTAEIRQTFSVPKVGTIAGCFVLTGKIARSHTIRLLRQSKIIWEGRLGSLRRFKDDVREVAVGYECGMNLDGYNDLKVGDVIEAYTNEEVSAS